ncbi:MAG: hypothetical protein ACI9BD_000118 [Candidatus Marinamargulisbacteria bacterium]|jgi:hypothetical protein
MNIITGAYASFKSFAETSQANGSSDRESRRIRFDMPFSGIEEVETFDPESALATGPPRATEGSEPSQPWFQDLQPKYFGFDGQFADLRDEMSVPQQNPDEYAFSGSVHWHCTDAKSARNIVMEGPRGHLFFCSESRAVATFFGVTKCVGMTAKSGSWPGLAYVQLKTDADLNVQPMPTVDDEGVFVQESDDPMNAVEFVLNAPLPSKLEIETEQWDKVTNARFFAVTHVAYEKFTYEKFRVESPLGFLSPTHVQLDNKYHDQFAEEDSDVSFSDRTSIGSASTGRLSSLSGLASDTEEAQ